ncbi:TPA: hypothetical protein MH691_02175 [Klebsiella pneumoniae]|nr:hypothetical protein DBV09_14915 [Klebsiella pneumoniae]ESA97642.1 hypothetical protein HMPREF1619_04983 [Klebsiella pneumoniae 909957]PIJ27221.1 hypothetical protein C630_06870 [Klebsiella pneumoniae subsp. pneumoniae KpO3210]QBP08129.1 hypothetical protein [Klebsiella phage ST405-OXA48phi1.3]HBX1747778.1 hypothetical protein [Klebsiella pneumoniae subsp. pneumoniae]
MKALGTMKENFTIEIRRYLINRFIDIAIEQKLSKLNYATRLENDKFEIMGCEPLDNPVTHFEKQVVQACSYRIKASLELAITLKVIKDEIHPVVLFGDHTWMQLYGVTRFGRLYRKLPRLLQTCIIGLTLKSQQLIKTTTKYKWLAGLVSFFMLAAKVWQSGAIDKAWIGISAASGLLFLWLLSFWR